MQSLINSPLGIGFALGITRLLPPSAGYKLGGLLAGLLAKRKSMPMIRAVRANQLQVNDHAISDEELDRLTSETLRHTAHCIYDLYHYLGDLERMQQLMHFGPDALSLVSRQEYESEGLVIVGPHISNVDLMLLGAGLKGLRAQVLGFARPGAGYQLQNRLRRKFGLRFYPASLKSMKDGVRHLKKGGTVVTGVDRPIPDSRYHPRFFGAPATVPVHYVSLAIQANVPIVVVSAIMNESGKYNILVSEPIAMKPGSTRKEEVLINAERVLEVVASIIRKVPYQWSMYYPVWPNPSATES